MDAEVPDPDVLARTLAFEREVVGSVSTRMVPFAWGTAYLNDGYRSAGTATSSGWSDRGACRCRRGRLAAEADRVFGEAGLTHREIRIDDDAYGRSVAADLARAGYGGDRLVVMGIDEPRTGRTRPMGRGGRPGRRSGRRSRSCCSREPWATTEEIVRVLADFRGELQRHAGARFFCARVDGEIAAMCELYVRGSMRRSRT